MREAIGKKGIKKSLIRVILSLATVVTFLHLSSTNVYAEDGPVTVTVSSWSDFTNALSISSSGTVIKLGGDLTANSTAELKANKTITVDLNGKTINLNGNNEIHVDAGTLIIKDSTAGEGKIYGCKSSQALLVDSGAKLVLERGFITDNDNYGIYLTPPSAQFEMTGGHITGNKTNLSDGRNNYETTTHPEYVKLLGGEITGADIGVNLRALTLGGSIKIKDNKKSGEDNSLQLWKSTANRGIRTVIKLDTNPIGDMVVNVYTNKDNFEAVILASGDYVAGAESYFYPADTLYREIVRKDDGGLVLRYKPATNWSRLTAKTKSMKFDDVSIEEALRFATKDHLQISDYNCVNYLVVYQMATGGKYKVFGFTKPSPDAKAVPYEKTLNELKEFDAGAGQDVYVVGTVTEGTLAHNWQYSVEEGHVAKLTASCDGYSCGSAAHDVSLTLHAEDANHHPGNHYTGASLGDTSAWTGVGLGVPEIEYTGRGSTSYTASTTAPIDAGTYTAKITVGGKTASKNFSINSIDPGKYGIEISIEGSGDAYAKSGDQEITQAAKDTIVSLVAEADPDYEFVKWESSDATLEGDGFTMPEHSVTIKAIFKKQEAPAPEPAPEPKKNEERKKEKKEEENPSFTHPDRDKLKSVLPQKTITVVSGKTVEDLKALTASDVTKANQTLLVNNFAKQVGKKARILATYSIHTNRMLGVDNGKARTLKWANLEKNPQVVYACCYNQTDKAYFIQGILDKNGTATFSNFLLRDATNITVFVLE